MKLVSIIVAVLFLVGSVNAGDVIYSTSPLPPQFIVAQPYYQQGIQPVIVVPQRPPVRYQPRPYHRHYHYHGGVGFGFGFGFYW